MRGILVQKVVVEVGQKLGGDVPHLREELGGLLAEVAEFRGQFGPEGDDGLGHHAAVLGAAKADDVGPAVGGQRPDVSTEGDSRVGEAGTVDVEVHAVGVDEIGDGAEFGRGIDGAQFGNL